jgi:predicted nucleic acid-binding protein
MSAVYLDTSVLAKRYLPSPQSDRVEAMLDRAEHRFILSELVVVELESTLRRRAAERPGKTIDRAKVRLRFDDDLRSGFFVIHPLRTSILVSARRWIAEGEPLATLDALHLATALDAHAEVLATDDRQFARAARAAGLRVETFV